MRPHLLVCALAVGLLLAGGPWVSPAYACTCAEPWSTEEALRKSDAVFSGAVAEIGRLPPEPPGTTTMTMPSLNPVTFDVKGAWKGMSGESTVVHGQGPAPSCGLDFERGETYLVFAYRTSEGGDSALQTDYCGNTFPASEETARNILGSPPEVLPDTGGIAPRPVPKSAASAYVAPTVIVALGVGLLHFCRALRRR